MADERSELHEPWAPPPQGATGPGDEPAPPGGAAPEAEGAGPPEAEPEAAPTAELPVPADTGTVVPAEPQVTETSPPPPPPYDYEAEGPTEVVPTTPPPPPPMAPPATASAAAGRRKWPGSAKATAIILGVALVAAAGGLGYAWWKTNEDKKDLENVTTQQSQELTAQLDKANADLNTTKSSLDAANKQVSDLQTQLKSAQDQAASSTAQANALKALFPVNASTTAAGLPGAYASGALGAQAGSCTSAPCPTAQLRLNVAANAGSLTVSDAALGTVPFQSAGAGWTATGPAGAALQLQCAGAPLPTTFVLTLAPAAVALDAQNKTQVTTLAGNLLLTAAAVAPVPPTTPGCPAGVASYVVAANRT
jgi:hypothetical protein